MGATKKAGALAAGGGSAVEGAGAQGSASPVKEVQVGQEKAPVDSEVSGEASDKPVEKGVGQCSPSEIAGKLAASLQRGEEKRRKEAADASAEKGKEAEVAAASVQRGEERKRKEEADAAAEKMKEAEVAAAEKTKREEVAAAEKKRHDAGVVSLEAALDKELLEEREGLARENAEAVALKQAELTSLKGKRRLGGGQMESLQNKRAAGAAGAQGRMVDDGMWAQGSPAMGGGAGIIISCCIISCCIIDGHVFVFDSEISLPFESCFGYAFFQLSCGTGSSEGYPRAGGVASDVSRIGASSTGGSNSFGVPPRASGGYAEEGERRSHGIGAFLGADTDARVVFVGGGVGVRYNMDAEGTDAGAGEVTLGADVGEEDVTRTIVMGVTDPFIGCAVPCCEMLLSRAIGEVQVTSEGCLESVIISSVQRGVLLCFGRVRLW